MWAMALILGVLALVVIDAIIASHARPRASRTPAIPADADPLRAIRTLAARAGGGVWLGAADDGQWKSRGRSGQYCCSVAAAVGQDQRRDHPGGPRTHGPTIVTSTKPDVARATAQPGRVRAGVDVRPERRAHPHLRDPIPGIPRADTGPRAE
jgi:hypothetical protein